MTNKQAVQSFIRGRHGRAGRMSIPMDKISSLTGSR